MITENKKRKWMYKFVLYKAYLDQGLGLTNYFRYVMAFFAIFSLSKNMNMWLTVYLGIAYFIFSFLLGWFWYAKGLMIAQAEVSNQFNYFVKEMRKEIKGKDENPLLKEEKKKKRFK